MDRRVVVVVVVVVIVVTVFVQEEGNVGTKAVTRFVVHAKTNDKRRNALVNMVKVFCKCGRVKENMSIELNYDSFQTEATSNQMMCVVS